MTCGVIFFLPFMAASGAASGVIPMVIGHAVLKRTELAVYHEFSVSSSAKLGAVGGAVMCFPLAILGGILQACAPQSENAQAAGGTGISLLGLLGIAGTGSKILLSHHYHVMGFVDALRTALLGAVVLAAASGALAIVIFALIALCAGVGGAYTLLRDLKAGIRERRVARGRGESAQELQVAQVAQDAPVVQVAQV